MRRTSSGLTTKVADRVRFGISMTLSLGMLAAIILSLVLIGSGEVRATSFNPIASATLSDPAPGANSDIVTTFGVAVPESNFGFLTTFTPKDFFVAPDADVPDGSSGVFLKSQATLGLINGPCQPGGLEPKFDMMDSTTNISGPTVGFNDIDGESPENSLGEIFEDDDGDTLLNGVQMYPDFLLNTFKDEGGSPLQPHARLWGSTNVVGVDVSLNFVIFPPGTTFVSQTTGNVLRTDPNLGYPSVTILQNGGDPTAEPEPGPITDFCTPLQSETTTFGLADGAQHRGNPAADGTYNFVLFAASMPDADNDGFENSFDTCPYDANLDGDPRGPADPERAGEGIDSACDPDPGTGQAGVGLCGPGTGDDFLASDCDADGYWNRADNCPLVANGEQQDNQRDGDGDAIGAACDRNQGTRDGHIHVLCVISPVTVGAGGDAPDSDQYICNETVVALDLNRNGTPDMDEGTGATDSDGDTVLDAADKCASTAAGAAVDGNGCSKAQVDSDGDGVCNPLTTSTLCTGSDRCEGTPAGATVDAVGCTPQQAVLDDDKDAVLNAADKCPGTAAGAKVDADGCSAAQLAQQQDQGGDGGVGDSGVGALAPAVSSISAWAAIASALGGAGLLGGLGTLASRILRRRR